MNTKEKTINEVIHVSVDDDTLKNITNANTLSTEVKSLTITNNEEYMNSGKFLKNIKGISKVIDDSRKEMTKPLDEIKKNVMAFFKEPLNEPAEAESILKKGILEYQQKQERIHREAEQKAIAKARLEEEKRRKILEERAKKEEEKGNAVKAEILKEKAEGVYVPTVVMAPTFEKVSGISTKKIWKARIKDFSKIPTQYYINDEKVQCDIQSIMNKLSSATKGALPVEGVDFYQEESLSARRV